LKTTEKGRHDVNEVSKHGSFEIPYVEPDFSEERIQAYKQQLEAEGGMGETCRYPGAPAGDTEAGAAAGGSDSGGSSSSSGEGGGKGGEVVRRKLLEGTEEMGMAVGGAGAIAEGDMLRRRRQRRRRLSPPGAAGEGTAAAPDRVQRLYLHSLKQSLTGYLLRTPSFTIGTGKRESLAHLPFNEDTRRRGADWPVYGITVSAFHLSY
jgi:hypothetical protein